MKIRIRFLALSSLIAALYAGTTYFLAPISYGPIQCRVSEALTVLPILTPAAIPGLYLGCLLANIFGGLGLPDIIFGSLFTLIAALGTYLLRKNTFLALLSPVLVNAFGVSSYLHLFFKLPYWLTAVSIFLGEAVAVYGFGYLLLLALRKRIDWEKY